MLYHSKTRILFVLFLKFCLHLGGAVELGDDLYSSVTAFEDILKTEKVLMHNLEEYIFGAGAKISLFKTFIDDLKEEHNHFAEQNLSSPTLDDPINLFKLKQRFSLNIPGLKKFFNKTGERIVDKLTNSQDGHEFPSSSDLEGVTLGLLRVQEVFKINAEQMASGKFLDINFGEKFSASDCFQVGFQFQKFEFHYYAIEWFEAALKRFRDKNNIGIAPEIDEIRILGGLAYSQYSEGSLENAKNAIETAVKALKLDRQINQRLYDHTVENFQGYIRHYKNLQIQENSSVEPSLPNGALSKHNLTETDLLKKACRGELNKSPREQRDLYCKYESENHPFLKLAPIKVEITNINPYFYLFHDVMYESEIEKLKNLSTQHLTRAGVWDAETGAGKSSQTRTSKFYWFRNESDPIFHILNQRVSDMTGLSMETSEFFQLMNYGIGGHYDIHSDDLPEGDELGNIKSSNNDKSGNRVSTVLFYISDVKYGGATVFPRIKTMAYPKKGTAVFWYNLFADGQPDARLRHSACPVISGSKWVVNKWIRLRSQEFRRPCKLYPDH